MNSLGEASVIALASAGACLLVGPPVIRRLSRAQCIAPRRYGDCPPLSPYDTAKPDTPTMGGLFALAVAAVMAIASGGLIRLEGWWVLGVLVALGAVGLTDDCLKFRGANAAGLRATPKLLAAMAVGGALGMASSGRSHAYSVLEVPWLGRAIDVGGSWVPLCMLVIAGCAHAVNLTDGMDGLAPGCLAIVFSAIGLWVATEQGFNTVLLPWCASLAGACLGFLWFNSFPASVFLGDVGALGLGGAFGAIGLLSRNALWLLVIGGVFVLEALSVILQVASYKWRGQRRVFRVAPIHHHFHLGGVSEPKLIVRFWIAGVLLALLGFTGSRLP